MKYIPLIALLLAANVPADWTDYRVDSIVAHACTEGTSVGPSPAQCGWYSSLEGYPSWGSASVLTDDTGWITHVSIEAGMWAHGGAWLDAAEFEVDGYIDGQKILTSGDDRIHFSSLTEDRLRFLIERDGSMVRYILKR